MKFSIYLNRRVFVMHSSILSGETSGGIYSGSSVRCFVNAFASEI